jgi:hypothetical protein
MKGKNGTIRGSDDIAKYTEKLDSDKAAICDRLRKTIDSVLPGATAKIYYAMPVWFVKGAPVVGYKAMPGYVNLLFWNGQSFNEEKLIAAGKFKAAQIKYKEVSEIDYPLLRRWLKKAGKDIWRIQCD